MEKSFRFSAPVTIWLVLLAIAASAVALSAPSISTVLAIAGCVACVIVWCKVAIRTKKWVWWEFGFAALTPFEGLIGIILGVVLFAAGFLAIILAMQNAT